MKILFVSPNHASFIARDLKILREKHDVIHRIIRHKNPLRFVGDVVALFKTDILFLWFASAYALPLVVLARMLGRKVVTVVGGYEVANVPEINYGSSRSPILRLLVRRILGLSGVVLAVSRCSAEEIRRYHPTVSDRTKIIYHGFEETSGDLCAQREQLVMNVGHVSNETWLKKGIYDFILVADEMRDIRFIQIGRQLVDVTARFDRQLPPNLTMVGEVPFEQLGRIMCTAKVYAQFSRHESFGCSVAEAMLHGCVPVVSGSAALPEVVGDCGVILESNDPANAAAAVQRALAMSDSEGERARQRIRQQFPFHRRRDALLRVIDELAAR